MYIALIDPKYRNNKHTYGDQKGIANTLSFCNFNFRDFEV